MAKVTERFGHKRSTCGCMKCKTYCRYVPSYLIPADLENLVPNDVNVFEWSEQNLRASPGAIVMKGGDLFAIPTLVPAVKENGHCINLMDDGKCAIHEVAPFGCAMFSCSESKKRSDHLTHMGLFVILKDHENNGLYHQIWEHLNSRGLVATAPEVLKEKMKRETGGL